MEVLVERGPLPVSLLDFKAVLQNKSVLLNDLPFCDLIIPLNSGHQVVAGSTRMKAGTATKKVLNFISSILMINMGKVEGSYLEDVSIINQQTSCKEHWDFLKLIQY